MSAAVEQSVSHLIVDTPTRPKEPQRTDQEERPELEFCEFMTQEESTLQELSPFSMKESLSKQKLQRASQKEDTKSPKDQQPSMEEISFPNVWVKQMAREEVVVNVKAQQTLQTLETPTPEDFLESDVLFCELRAAQDACPELSLQDEIDNQDLTPAPLYYETKEIKSVEEEVLTHSPYSIKDSSASESFEATDPSQHISVLDLLRREPMGHQRSPQELRGQDISPLTMDDAQEPSYMNLFHSHPSVPMEKKETSLKEELASLLLQNKSLHNATHDARFMSSKIVVGALEKDLQVQQEPQIDLASVQNLSENASTLSLANPMGRGENAPFMIHGARQEGVSPIVLQTEGVPLGETQSTLLRTPTYSLVHVDVKMPSLQESGTLKMRLDPAHLGKVEVEVTLTHDGRMDAVVSVSKSETFEIMRQDSEALARVIAEAFDQELGHLDFSLNHEGHDKQPLFEDSSHNPLFLQEGTSSHAVLAFQTQPLDPARMLDALA